MADKKPNWMLLKECAYELLGMGIVRFTRGQLIECVRRKYPDIPESSLNPMIQGMTVNLKGGSPGGIGKNLFYSVGRGSFELYDPVKHGSADLLDREPPVQSDATTQEKPPEPKAHSQY